MERVDKHCLGPWLHCPAVTQSLTLRHLTTKTDATLKIVLLWSFLNGCGDQSAPLLVIFTFYLKCFKLNGGRRLAVKCKNLAGHFCILSLKHLSLISKCLKDMDLHYHHITFMTSINKSISISIKSIMLVSKFNFNTSKSLNKISRNLIWNSLFLIFQFRGRILWLMPTFIGSKEKEKQDLSKNERIGFCFPFNSI